MQNEDLENKTQEEMEQNQDSTVQDGGNQTENADSKGEEEKKDAEQPSPEELLMKERDEWKDKYMRLFAEFDNYKKRTLREKKEWFREAKSDVITDLLPVLDDFDRAKTANANNEDVAMLKEGFDLIHHKLFHALENKGLKPMNSMHQEFNTDLHEAITNIPAPEKKLKGKVVDVVETGYTLNDHIIRFAKVVVGQ
jgi:molecular chaperone GrpE